jgi:hypothetical protein
MVLALPLAVAAAAEPVRTQAAGLRFSTPAEWVRVPATSDMRAAQFRVPRAGSDAEDGEAILFFFGKGKGGGTDDNLQRWYAQMAQPDGRASKDVGVVTIKTVHGLRVTSLELPGTYKPMASMGGGDASPKPGYRLLAAVIEGDAGPWFVRVVGPDATVRAAKPGFDALVDGVEAHE